MSDAEANDAPKEKREYILIKVIGQDSTNEIHFRIGYSTPMAKLKKCYADRIGKGVSHLRFLFDGRRITDDATPKTLEMEQEDVVQVEVFDFQMGGISI